jgi:hypothetical protein
MSEDRRNPTQSQHAIQLMGEDRGWTYAYESQDLGGVTSECSRHLSPSQLFRG